VDSQQEQVADQEGGRALQAGVVQLSAAVRQQGQSVAAQRPAEWVVEHQVQTTPQATARQEQVIQRSIRG
jgi:hypothetical protein